MVRLPSGMCLHSSTSKPYPLPAELIGLPVPAVPQDQQHVGRVGVFHLGGEAAELLDHEGDDDDDDDEPGYDGANDGEMEDELADGDGHLAYQRYWLEDGEVEPGFSDDE
jgi:hypothetical protein